MNEGGVTTQIRHGLQGSITASVCENTIPIRAIRVIRAFICIGNFS